MVQQQMKNKREGENKCSEIQPINLTEYHMIALVLLATVWYVWNFSK